MKITVFYSSLITMCLGFGVWSCGESTCGPFPLPLLHLKVIDGISGAKLPKATVTVNGHKIPFNIKGVLVEEGKICDSRSPMVVDCTHGIYRYWFVPGFDPKRLAVDVSLAGYSGYSFVLIPEFNDNRLMRSEYRIVKIFPLGQGVPGVSANMSQASPGCQ